MRLPAKSTLATFFFTLCAIQSYGQTYEGSTKNQLKLSPAKILDLINPGLEIGYERRTGNFSIHISATFYACAYSALFKR